MANNNEFTVEDKIRQILNDIVEGFYNKVGRRNNAVSEIVLGHLEEINQYILNNQPLPSHPFNENNNREITDLVEMLKEIVDSGQNARDAFINSYGELINAMRDVLEGGMRRHRKHKTRKARRVHKKRHTRRHKRATKRRHSLRRKN
jgi:hypothetical protein